MATRPTFCANAVYGNVLNTPPRTVPRPSAHTVGKVSGVIFLSTISPTATMSPVVSGHDHDGDDDHRDDGAELELGQTELERLGMPTRRFLADGIQLGRLNGNVRSGADDQIRQHRHPADPGQAQNRSMAG